MQPGRYRPTDNRKAYVSSHSGLWRMPSLRNSPSGQFSLGSNGTVLARLLRTITRFRKPLGLKGFCAPALPSPPYPPSRPMVAGQTECAAPGYAMRSVGRCSVLELFWQQAEISVCRLRMAVQSLLMAIQRPRMCIQRLQTEISPSLANTSTIVLEGIMKGGGRTSLCTDLFF